MQEVDHITSRIIASAIRVHRKYGPGLLESVYIACLGQELVAAGLLVELEKPLSLEHDGLIIHRAYIIDLLVEEQVIVEIKCVSRIAPIHIAQVRTYLKLTGLHVGLIINFNVTRLVDGLKRVVHEYADEAADRDSGKASEVGDPEPPPDQPNKQGA